MCNHSLFLVPSERHLAHTRTPAQTPPRDMLQYNGHHMRPPTTSLHQLLASPLIGGGGGAPPQTIQEKLPHQSTSIHTINDWIHLLNTLTKEEFASLVDSLRDDECTPCFDVSGFALLRPSQIQRYTYGNWQCDLDIHDCMEGIFRASILFEICLVAF